MRKIPWGLCLTLGLMLTGMLSGPALAEKTANLSPVVVTATKTEKELVEVPTSIAVVGSDVIKAQPQSTVAELLRDIPGVQVQDQSVAGVKRVVIRGESPARSLVLIDGQKISEQKSMDGIPLMLDQNSVERIELIKGPASVLYGSEAIGGVINIITKKGGKRPVQADVSCTYNSASDAVTSAASLYGSAQNFDYRVSASYTDADNLHTPSGKLKDSSYLNRDLSGYLGYNWDNGSMALKVEHFWSNNNIAPVKMGPMGFLDLDLPEWNRDKIGLFFEQRNINPWLTKIQANVFYQKTKKIFENGMDMRLPPSPAPFKRMVLNLHTENDQKTLGGDLQIDWMPASSVYVVTGLSYLKDYLDADEIKKQKMYFKTPPPAPAPPFAPTNAKNFYEGHQDNLAFFTQAEWNLAQDWMLTAGLRQTFINTELDKSNNPMIPTRSESSSRPVGSIGVVYSGLSDWTLRALFAQGYRVPTIQQLFLGTDHGARTLPNPDLNEETSNNFEIGARYNNGGFKLDTVMFTNWSRDYIMIRSIAPGLGQFDNAEKARTYGLETELSYLFEQTGLTPYLSAAYMRRQFESGGVKTWKTGTPALTGRTGCRYERELTNDLMFTSDLYARFASKSKEKGQPTKDGWTTCNLALGLLYGPEQNYRLSLNVNNIFDKKYVESSAGLESPGVHAIVRLDVSF